NYSRDGVQASLETHGKDVEEGKLLQSMGFQSDAPAQDNFTGAYQTKQVVSQAHNAKVGQTPFEISAPRSILSYEMRRQWEWFTSYGQTDEVRRQLAGALRNLDRIGKFTKWWYNLKQLAWRNEHIKGLVDYVNYNDLMKIKAEEWLNKANETAREWEKVPEGTRREAVAQALFDLTEMDYLSPRDRANGVVRLPFGWADFLRGQPPQHEVAALFAAARVHPADHAIIRRVAQDFAGFLNDVQKVMEDNLRKTFVSSPAELANALTKLHADFNEYRNKPYFPMVRFGEFTITVRDLASGKVV